jgi:hypothetical protein
MSKNQEEIKKSKEESHKKYLLRKELTKQKQQRIKEGIKFIHENNLENNIFKIWLGGHEISICYKTITNYMIYQSLKGMSSDKNMIFIKYAYTIKSLNDQYNYRIAKSILGQRLFGYEKDKSISLQFYTKTPMLETQIKNLITSSIYNIVSSPHHIRAGVPKKLHKIMNSVFIGNYQ